MDFIEFNMGVFYVKNITKEIQAWNFAEFELRLYLGAYCIVKFQK